MKEQPKTVVCTSCSAKFLVPDELIRGKLVKFRCRKCGSAIDVDGRKSARSRATLEPPPPPPAPTGIDTPATFSQRTIPPPPRPPTALSQSAPTLHPWPEPPRSRSTTAPTSLSESSPPEESLPRLESLGHPSNRGAKIAAVAALFVAAGLSGIGLAMRGSPPGAASAGESVDLDGLSRPYIPPGASEPARSRAETWGDNANRSHRSPTRVTDLPRAAESDRPTGAGSTAAAKAFEAPTDRNEPSTSRDPIGAGPAVPIAKLEMPAPAAPAEPAAAMNAPSATDTESTTQEDSPTSANAGNGTGLPNAAPQPAANAPGVAAAPPTGARAKGDFNTQAAREALEDAAVRAAKCKTIDTPAGNARVAVTFAPNGHVTNAVIDSGPIVGTAAGTCVAGKFRAAKVPAFSGEPVLVRKNVKF
jgi:predicted Zn finger-like uncharacterized protein